MTKFGVLLGVIALMIASSFSATASASTWSEWKSFAATETKWKYRTRWFGPRNARGFEFQVRVFHEESYYDHYAIVGIVAECSNGGVDSRARWTSPIGPLNIHEVGTTFSHRLQKLCAGKGRPTTMDFKLERRSSRDTNDYDDGF